MAVRRRHPPLGAAMQTLKERIQELTDGLTSVNEALGGLVAQAGQFARLTGAMGAPVAAPETLTPITTSTTHGSLAEARRPAAPTFQLSAEEMAKRQALLQQFNGKAKLREEIEAEMDSGAAQ